MINLRDDETITVLIVESDPEAALLTKEKLEEQHGIDAVIESKPSNVLEQINSKDIDCVVSEWDLPEKRGTEILEDVRDFDKRFPFIIYTGKGSERIAKESISSGATDYLIKSLDSTDGLSSDNFETLAQRIRTAVQHYRSTKWREKSLRRQYFAIILAILSITIGLFSIFISI